MPIASDNTIEIIHYALIALRSIYKEGYEYKKAGIIVMDIVPKANIQLNLFDEVDRVRQDKAVTVLDEVNGRMGKHIVELAIQGNQEKAAWKMERKHLSPCYTTKWDELWTINI